MSETGSAPDGAEENETVVQRMASRRLLGNSGRITPVPALKAALPKAAELELDMQLQVLDVKEGMLGTQQVIEAIPEEALIAVLSANDGARALAGVDPQLLAALIETQTLGLVRKGPSEPRNWTTTDGRMTEPFINRVFDVLELILDADGRGPWFYGYRFLNKVGDRRKLAMTLEEARFLFYICKVDIGDGAKTGKFWLAMPDDVRHATSAGHLAPGAEDWQDGLRMAVLESQVQLNAVLHRMELPLAEILRLKTGDLVKFPGHLVEDIAVEGSENRLVVRARLGQARGRRALRLRGMAPRAILKAEFGEAGLPEDARILDGVASPSAMPPMPSVPDIPGGPMDFGSPPGGSLPDGLPDLPGAGGDTPVGAPPPLGDLPDLPDMGTAGADPGGLPDLPDLPPLPGGGAEGDLPGLPDLAELPPLP